MLEAVARHFMGYGFAIINAFKVTVDWLSEYLSDAQIMILLFGIEAAALCFLPHWMSASLFVLILIPCAAANLWIACIGLWLSRRR